MSRTLLIIGGGIAGTTVAEEVRKIDAERRIIILDAESAPLYSRVLLPHYIKGKVAREKVFLKTEQWYIDQHIERLSVTATAIDRAARLVSTNDGQAIAYNDLVITTGTQPRRLESDEHFYLATIEDADCLVAELQRAEGPTTGFVYGGGFIACEFVNIFAHYGLPATVFLRGNGFWNGVLPEDAQLVIENLLVAGGVTVRTNEDQTSFAAAALPATLMGVGIGSPADFSLAERAGLACHDGIICDEYLRTGDEHVFVAGDVARRESAFFGRAVRFANWQNAQMQGRALGKTLLGTPTKPPEVSTYSTNILGTPIVFIGDVEKAAADEIRTIALSSTTSEHHYLRDGKLMGAVLIGEVTKRAALTARIGQ